MVMFSRTFWAAAGLQACGIALLLTAPANADPGAACEQSGVRKCGECVVYGAPENPNATATVEGLECKNYGTGGLQWQSVEVFDELMSEGGCAAAQTACDDWLDGGGGGGGGEN
jgi:hypothetical protein